MSQRGKEFLTKLADLLEQYDAEIRYTQADNGLHISVDDSEVFAGWLEELGGSNDGPKDLREAATKL